MEPWVLLTGVVLDGIGGSGGGICMREDERVRVRSAGGGGSGGAVVLPALGMGAVLENTRVSGVKDLGRIGWATEGAGGRGGGRLVWDWMEMEGGGGRGGGRELKSALLGCGDSARGPRSRRLATLWAGESADHISVRLPACETKLVGLWVVVGADREV